jgi:bifunctional N-acetylglucosamine-1-phosphate-uridyltransferase/glucosamine-1-phosphate-acetyltransferase GlmU-like protein
LQPVSVVVLAGGSGTRFGGPKQLAAVAPDGGAIFAVLVQRAAEAGFERAVLVIAPGMAAAVHTHLATRPDPGIPVTLATQHRPLGTADAVLAARDALDGAFVVVNGDDLYPADAFTQLHDHLANGPADAHAMVAFRVARTLTGNRPVMRARIEVDAGSLLVSIREGAVVPGDHGLRFEIDGASTALADDALVSMNMWAFQPSIFAALDAAVARFAAAPNASEVYLPDAVAAQVAEGTSVRVLVSEARCIGVTHREDLDAVRRLLA